MAFSTKFSGETMQAILQRMLGAITENVDKRQGSVTYDLLAPAAAELAQAYMALDQVLTFGFVSPDMPREYLELRAAELGIEPRPATKAFGKLTFTGPEGTVIPSGTRVSTDDTIPQYFVTTADVTIPAGGVVSVSAEAEQAGAAGNVAAGDITLVLGDLSGIVSVTNPEAFEGGADVESDESLLNRYYRRARRAATSGNTAHYEEWALSIPGVGDVRVIPTWDGPGTVKVVILGDDKRAPDSSVVSAVQEYIDPNQNGDGSGQAPIGAVCTVVPAAETAINVSAIVTLATGATIEQVTADFNAGLDEYLASLAYKDPLVRYTQIAGILLGIPDIIDFENLTVNGGTSNIEIDIDAGDVAVRGEVNLNAV